MTFCSSTAQRGGKTDRQALLQRPVTAVGEVQLPRLEAGDPQGARAGNEFLSEHNVFNDDRLAIAQSVKLLALTPALQVLQLSARLC